MTITTYTDPNKPKMPDSYYKKTKRPINPFNFIIGFILGSILAHLILKILIENGVI